MPRVNRKFTRIQMESPMRPAFTIVTFALKLSYLFYINYILQLLQLQHTRYTNIDVCILVGNISIQIEMGNVCGNVHKVLKIILGTSSPP